MLVAGVAPHGRRRHRLRATDAVVLLLVAATIGVLSPTGNEVGPFLAIEQAALSQAAGDARRTAIFAWYNLVGYVATASGALGAGLVGRRAAPAGWARRRRLSGDRRGLRHGRPGDGGRCSPVSDRRSRCRPAGSRRIRRRLGLGRSQGIVCALSALFALDAFAGGFVPQSLMAFWFHLRFGVEPGGARAIFFGANLLAAVSSAVGRTDRRPDRAHQHDGLHPPAVERAADPRPAHADAAARDRRPARSASASARWTSRRASRTSMAVVDPDERSAAAGVTGIARTTGAALSPALSAPLVASAVVASVPFFLAGGLKIVYDLLLWRAFRAVKPPEERADRAVEPGSRSAQPVGGVPVRPGIPGRPRRSQTKSRKPITTSTAIRRSNGWSACRMSTQFAPS